MQPGVSSVTEVMVTRLEMMIDTLDEQFEHPTEFVVPGGNVVAAWLDLGRTVVRRAERESLQRRCGTVARRPVPQPPVRCVVDDGALARGHEPHRPRLIAPDLAPSARRTMPRQSVAVPADCRP